MQICGFDSLLESWKVALRWIFADICITKAGKTPVCDIVGLIETLRARTRYLGIAARFGAYNIELLYFTSRISNQEFPI